MNSMISAVVSGTFSEAAAKNDGSDISRTETQIAQNIDEERKETSVEDKTQTGDCTFEWESLKTKESKETLAEENRDQWENQLDFVMSCLSFSVGLGNVWRFPFVAYENGGGAFLIPYVTMLLVLGIPMYTLELSVGQFCSRGPIGIWDMAPIFRGVGWSFLLIGVCTIFYYMAIVGICTVYFFHGFASELPWKHCYFYNGKSDWYATEGRKIFKTLQCKENQSFGEYKNNSGHTLQISNAELFYYYAVMKQADNMNNGLGLPDLYLSLSMYLVWTFILLTVMFGSKSAGKMAYFFALFPYFVLIILFIKALTLSGSTMGIKYFFNANWAKIGSMEVWFRALCQVFFSLGVGYGVLTQFGSYGPIHKKVYKDVIFVCIADTLTSILAGMTVFGILGVLAERKQVPIELVTKGGYGLAFISYPEIIVHFGGNGVSQVFSALFFLMLFTFGLGSGAGNIQVICGTVFDRVPFINRRRCFRIAFTAFVCFAFATCGLIFTTPAGNYLIEFFDFYSSGFVVMAVVIFQTAGIAYIYGMKNFVRDLQFMFFNTMDPPGGCGRTVLTLYQFWGYAVPPALTFVLIYIIYLAASTPLTTHDGNRVPFAMSLCGWALFSVIVCIIPVYSVALYCTQKSSQAYKKLLSAVTPNKKWGPKSRQERAKWEDEKGDSDGTTQFWKLTFARFCNQGKRRAEMPKSMAVEGIPNTKTSQDEIVQQNASLVKTVLPTTA